MCVCRVNNGAANLLFASSKFQLTKSNNTAFYYSCDLVRELSRLVSYH